MFCIKCRSNTIRVVNTRHSKKVPSIWRRRQCQDCNYTFTTREEVAIEDLIQIGNQPFSLPKLAVSLVTVLPAAPDQADDAYWLAKTVFEHLVKQSRVYITIGELKLTTRDVLYRFNPAAAAQYELKYSIATPAAKPRRGRPRLKR